MGVYGFLLVFLGGGIGSAARHGFNLLAAKCVGTAYPIGTFAINLVGAFAMQSTQDKDISRPYRLHVDGVCDGMDVV